MRMAYLPKSVAVTLALCLIAATAYAREAGSTLVSRKHAGAVLCITPKPGVDSFFSGGEDGFITLHSIGTIDETWQVSDMPIRAIAVHPSGNTLACYESDGFTTHRLSVWNWEKKTRIFAKRFRDSITSIAWSARGSWIMVGNTSLEGISVIDGKSGDAKRMFRSPQGLVYISVTGSSESSVMTFGPSGTIRYTDTSNGSERAVYDGPRDITNAVLISNNRILSGYLGDSVVSIDATKGTVIDTFASGEPIFATLPGDSVPVWIERNGGNYILRSGKASSKPFTSPDGSLITAAAGLPEYIAIGTESGQVLTFPRGNYSDSGPTLLATAHEAIVPVDDIISDGETLYILAAGTVFASTDPSAYPMKLFGGIDANRMEKIGVTFLFWSTKSASPLFSTDLSGNGRHVLYTPIEGISSLNHNNGVISCVEGTSTVVVLKPEITGEAFRYSGAGLQDAVPLTGDSIIVSKSATSRSPFPLLYINSATGETVPLSVSGDLCFSLKLANSSANELRGLLVKGGNPPSTELFSLVINTESLSSSKITVHATYKDEDLRASIAVDSRSILTNLGKTSLALIDSSSGRQRSLVRDYALPAKGAFMKDYFVGLNYDGSLTWYDKAGKGIAATAALVGIDEWAQ